MSLFNAIRRFFVSDAKDAKVTETTDHNATKMTTVENSNFIIQSPQSPSASLSKETQTHTPKDTDSKDLLFKHPSETTKNRHVSFTTPLNPICEEESESEPYMEHLSGDLHRSQSYEDLRQIYNFAEGGVSRANSVH